MVPLCDDGMDETDVGMQAVPMAGERLCISKKALWVMRGDTGDMHAPVSKSK